MRMRAHRQVCCLQCQLICVRRGRCAVYTTRTYCLDAKLPEKMKQLQPLQQLRSCTDMNPVKKKQLQCKTTNGIRTQVDLDNNRASRSCQQFPEAIWSVNLIVVLTFCPTTFCLATLESAILANFGPKMTNSTMWAW